MNNLTSSLQCKKINMAGLFLLLLLVVVLVLAQTALTARNDALRELNNRSRADLGRYMLTLQQKLERYQDLPSLLSSHSQLQTLLNHPNDADARLQANIYLEQVNLTIEASEVYLMDLSGTTVAASNWIDKRTFVGRNFAFRPYFTDAVEGRAGRYFALGTTSNKRGYFFSYPVWMQGKISGVVVLKIDLNDIENDWGDPLRDILVTDEDGIIFISTRPDWKFRSLAELSKDDLVRVTESLRYGRTSFRPLEVAERVAMPFGGQLLTLLEPASSSIEHKPREKLQYLMLSAPLSDSGLQVSILSSMTPVKEQMLEALFLATATVLALFLLVVVLITRSRIKRERSRFKQQRSQTLEESATRIRAIIDSTRAGLITLDSKGVIHTVNPTAEALFGYSEKSLLGLYFSKLLGLSARPLFWNHLNSSTSEQRELFLETEGVCSNRQTFPIEMIVGDLQVLKQERGYIVTIHDITERKRYENALKAAHEELELRVIERTHDLTRANSQLTEEIESHRNTQNELIQTAKLAILGQMSAGINHELNQPLAAIRAYADNARVFLERGRVESADTNLSEISRLTERMAKIIHPLKEFARKTTGTPEPVCLQQVKNGAMSILYGRLSKENVSVSWPDDLSEIYVMADALRLEQVLVNLLGNAIQAMENLAEKKIDIEAEHADQHWFLRVRDYGLGIPNEGIQRIFEPFYTTKKAGQGLGLGLSISHRIIVNLGGSLTAENHPEGGAVFTICLPVATPSLTQHKESLI